MYYYFKQDDGFFNHFYRIETTQFYSGEYHNALHINETSPCINHCTIKINRTLVPTTEIEFNKVFKSVSDSFGLITGFKSFKFI